MYKTHEVCNPPDSTDECIWRFMDLPKFISILEKKALFFSKVSKLDQFDRFEGHYPKITAEKMRDGRNKAIDEILKQMDEHGTPQEVRRKYIGEVNNASSDEQIFREVICVIQ